MYGVGTNCNTAATISGDSPLFYRLFFVFLFGLDGNVANTLLEAETDGLRCFGKDHKRVFINGTYKGFERKDLVFLNDAENYFFAVLGVPAGTVQNGDSMYGNLLVDVLNEAGAAGLNIIVLYGHNHSASWEDSHGGAAVYYQPGDTINVAQSSRTV